MVDVRTTLAARSYNITGYNSGCANYSAIQVEIILTVEKGGINIDMWLNGTPNGDNAVTYPSDINATCKINISAQNSFVMHRNGTSVGSQSGQVIEYNYDSNVSVWNFTCYYEATENYTTFSRTNYMTVSKGSRTADVLFDKISPIAYTETLNATCSISAGMNDGTRTLYRNISGSDTDVTSTENGQDITLPSGTWNYTCNITDGENYTASGTAEMFIVNKGTCDVDLWLNSGTVDDDNTISYGTTANATAVLNVSGMSWTLLRNGSIVDSGTDVLNESVGLGVGTYNYTGNWNGNENYTGCYEESILSVVDTIAPKYWYNVTNNTISDRPTLFSLNWTDDVGLSGYIFSTNNTGTWVNDSWIAMTGLADWSNITKTLNSTVGAFVQWRVYANDTSDNWNASLVYNLTTIDADTPKYSNNQSQLITTYTYTGYSNFSVIWNDNSGSLHDAYLEHNFTGTLQNESMDGSYPTYTYNSTVLPAGDYQFRFVANDSAGNDNATEVRYFTISKADSTSEMTLTLDGDTSTPQIRPYTNVTRFLLTESNSGDGGCSYDIWL
jgi:hypothetical protein